MLNFIRLKYKMLNYARTHALDIPPGFHPSTPMWGEPAKKLAWRVSTHLREHDKKIPVTTSAQVIHDYFFPPSSLSKQIVATARQCIEQRTSEHTITSWYGFSGPWCAMTWSYIKHKAGSKTDKMAYVPFIIEQAAHRRSGLMLVSKPQPGDGVIYDWQFDHEADHIETLLSKNGRYITTAAGNSGPPYVIKRYRTTANVIAWIRVSK